MKKKLAALAILPLLLSCSNKGKAELGDYLKSLPLFDSSHHSLRVLQLTDIHWNLTTDMDKQSAYINALVKNASPDLVMITGDQVLTANKENYETLFDLFESWSALLKRDVYYGVTWGNHDQQGYWDAYYSGRLAGRYDHSLYTEVDDDLTGESNYVINLTDSSGKTLWQLYALDTNSLAYSFPDFNYSYDTVHDEQVDWFEEEVKLAQKSNPDVKNVVYFHIPLWETEYAYRLAMGDKLSDYSGCEGEIRRYSGEIREARKSRSPLGPSNMGTSATRSKFFSVAESLGASVAMFYGHDHINSFAAEYRLSGKDDYISLIYGLKTGDGLYYGKELLGGTLITINDDMSYSLARCFQSYEDSYDGGAGYKEEAMYQEESK